MVLMSSSEEDSYTMIYSSLKHPIRRKILRTLSSQPQTFSDLLKQFKIESSHLTYHIDGLGNLLYKTEDGKYALSSLGDGAVSMMKNVEEPPTTSHLPFMRAHSSISERRVFGRAVVIALGIVCIVLVATLVGAFTYYVPMINSKNSAISSLNSQVSNLQNQTASDNAAMTNLQNQIDSLQSQIAELEKNASSDNATIANLQNQLNLLTNWSLSIEDMILSNPADWVNKTVMVEGTQIAYLAFFPFESSPYDMQLGFGNKNIGLVLTPSVGGQISAYTSPFWIYGVVRQSEVTYAPWTSISPQVTYYIEAEKIESL
jgi:DNA-binding transcriptional ArsR family regulator